MFAAIDCYASCDYFPKSDDEDFDQFVDIEDYVPAQTMYCHHEDRIDYLQSCYDMSCKKRVALDSLRKKGKRVSEFNYIDVHQKLQCAIDVVLKYESYKIRQAINPTPETVIEQIDFYYERLVDEIKNDIAALQSKFAQEQRKCASVEAKAKKVLQVLKLLGR